MRIKDQHIHSTHTYTFYKTSAHFNNHRYPFFHYYLLNGDNAKKRPINKIHLSIRNAVPEIFRIPRLELKGLLIFKSRDP